MSKIKALYKVLEDKNIYKKLNNYQNTKQSIEIIINYNKTKILQNALKND